MEICGHCHNVLSKTVDRCTVCGTERVDPEAADVRRRDNGDLPSHAPGWAAPTVPEAGIHPDEFLRELTGEEATSAAPEPSVGPNSAPILPPRQVPSTPAPGALAGYLGTNVNRSSSESEQPHVADPAASGPPEPQLPPPDADTPTQAARFATHLSTATRVAPDGVAARTTRLDGTVQLGPTQRHRLLTIGGPLVATALVVGGILGSYRIQTSEAQQTSEAELAEASIDLALADEAEASVLRLDLDGCGIIDQTTGFLFADHTILVPQSAIVTDNRPTVFTSTGGAQRAETLGWSLARNLAVVRTDERLAGGLEWGVSSRIREGDVVSVLAITDPGVAAPVTATIAIANTINGRNTSFELDVAAPEGSVVLDASGFVVGVFDDRGLALASDDVAPAVSRIVLANERPQAICPAPPTTLPPTTVVGGEGDTGAEETQPTVPDK